MGRNISLQEAGNRWVKESLRSYLEGKKNLKWITGVLRGASKDKIRSLFDSLGRSGTAERKVEFLGWLNQTEPPLRTK